MRVVYGLPSNDKHALAHRLLQQAYCVFGK